MIIKIVRLKNKKNKKKNISCFYSVLYFMYNIILLFMKSISFY